VNEPAPTRRTATRRAVLLLLCAAALPGAGAFGAASAWAVPPPTVTKIEPNTGAEPGGIEVTITGTNFVGVTAVKFGPTNAESLEPGEDANSIVARSPKGSGTVDVTVTASGGTSATGAADRFTYHPGPVAIAHQTYPGGPYTGDNTVPVGLNGCFSRGAVTYQWVLPTEWIPPSGPPPPSSECATSISIPAKRARSVSLVVTDEHGRTDSTTLLVEGHPIGAPGPLRTSPHQEALSPQVNMELGTCQSSGMSEYALAVGYIPRSNSLEGEVKTAKACGWEPFTREPGYEYQAGLWDEAPPLISQVGGAVFPVYPVAGPIIVSEDPSPAPDTGHVLVDLSACDSSGTELYRWTTEAGKIETGDCQLRGVALAYGKQTVELTVVSGHGVVAPTEQVSFTLSNAQPSGACSPYTLDFSSCLPLIPAMSRALGFARPPDFLTLSEGAYWVVGAEWDTTATCGGLLTAGPAVGIGGDVSISIGLGWVGNPLSSVEPKNEEVNGFIEGTPPIPAETVGGGFGPAGGQLMVSANKHGPFNGEVLLLGLHVGGSFTWSLPFNIATPSKKPPGEPCSWDLATFQSLLGIQAAPPSATSTQGQVISTSQTSTANVSSGSTVSIVGAAGSYAPGSVVVVASGSVQAPLGAVKAAKDGSFILVTQIPTFIPSGGHTLLISGEAPDGSLENSSVPLSLSGGPAVTVALVTPNAGPAAGGQTVTVRGTGFSTTPGATEIYFGPGNAGTAINCSSEMSCSATAPPGKGVVSVTATAGGHESPQGSKGALFSYEVPTTTTVTSSVEPAAVGEAVSFTARVTGAPRVGTVTFYDDGEPLCEHVLLGSPGVASCSTFYGEVATHRISATYSGGPGLLGSASNPIIETISKEQPREDPPVNITTPAISGTLKVGQRLNCSPGVWSNNPSSYAYQWLHDGSAIDGGGGSTYTVELADAGHTLNCRVTATNRAGSASARSAGVQIPVPESASATSAGVQIPVPKRPPNSNFAMLGTSVDSKTGAITFTESVSDPGTFNWAVTFQNGKFGVFAARKTKCRTGFGKLKGKCRAGRIMYAKGNQAFAAAGTVTFTVKPTASATKALRNALARKRGVSVTAALTFQSSLGGNPVAHTDLVVVKLKSKKRLRGLAATLWSYFVFARDAVQPAG
jgi:hypothetical protein